jgi:RNA polymerase sigma-70 factor (family 1)
MTAAETSFLLKQMADHNDGAALGQLFKAYYPRLVVFAEPFLQNRQVAEELVEDVFIKLWENKTLAPAISNLPAYLFRAVKNNVINYLKPLKNQAWLDIDDANPQYNTRVKSPEELLVSVETLRRIDAAIASLPSKCRLIFRLIKEDGLKYKEAAELLDISQKTVEAQMAIALRKMTELLAELRVKY